jgi:hypothetical protein
MERSVPPPALLEIARGREASGEGCCCWRDDQGAPICAGIIGIPTALDPLVTPSQFTVLPYLSFTQPVTEVQLPVCPVTLEQQLAANSRGLRWWRPELKGREKFTLKPENAKFIDLSPGPGLHVLSLFVRVEGRDDSSYGFLMEAK